MHGNASQVESPLHELATIFAAGVLRLQKQGHLRDITPFSEPHSLPACLEVPSKTVLSVPHG